MTDLAFLPTKKGINPSVFESTFPKYTGIFQLSIFTDKFVHTYASHTCDWIPSHQQIPVQETEVTHMAD